MKALFLLPLALLSSACSSDSSMAGAHGGMAGAGAAGAIGGPTGGSAGALGSMGGSSSSGGATGGAPTGGGNTGGNNGAAGVAVVSGGQSSGGRAGAGGDSPGGAGSSFGGVSSGGETVAGGQASTSGGAGTGGLGVAGALSTGGSGGTSGGGASGSGGTSACAGLVCEDFESGKIEPTKWDLVAKGGTLTVQTQHVAHGQYAAAVHGQPGSADDWALLVAKGVPAALKSATTFGRVYFYWAPEATASIHIQMAFAGHTGSGSANGPAPFTKLRYMEVASYGGRWQLGFDLLDLSPLVEEVSYSDGRLPTNTWACLEWKFEDAPDRVTAWVNGAEVSRFDNTNVDYASPGPAPKSGGALWDGKSSDLIGGFDTFGVGFHDWHPQKAFDVYYDDVVLDSKRVGCL